MAMPKQAEEMIVGNLIEALERLRKDLDKVELWAAALGQFRGPVPDYEPSERYLLRPLSDGRPPNLRS
jgi:hypothetical protein